MTDPDPALGLYRLLPASAEQYVSGEAVLTDAELVRVYCDMRFMRLLDSRMVALQRQGRIGFYGSSTGQEAVVVGAATAIEREDWVFPALRESGIMLLRGFPLPRYLAQLFGNSLDVLQGRQMPSHMSGRQVHQVSWSSAIGTQLPQAVGAAWAARMKGDRNITLAFLGDGATSSPDFHAAMNFAGVFSVPCIFVCQNNHWSISTPSVRQTASETIAVKAKAYGMPGIRVDGNDVLAVHGTVKNACVRARSGQGPTLIEAVTYRMGAHSTSDDPTRYQSVEELEAWRQRDPIDRLGGVLLGLGLLDRTLIEQGDAEAARQIDSALQEAERHGPPSQLSLFEDVYQRLPWHLREQYQELSRASIRSNRGPSGR
ncbi:MAG: 3-methyl-2-oxobutanoate dehydrogenase [Polyangiaceae bacterium]|nr:3-methyl-2-oxobutanoate dehydrogenase [Polyangiaceae bacterium]